MTVSKQIADRLAFCGLDQEMRDQLAAFLPTLERALPPVIDAFYANIARWPQLAQMFGSKDAMRRAGDLQSGKRA